MSHVAIEIEESSSGAVTIAGSGIASSMEVEAHVDVVIVEISVDENAAQSAKESAELARYYYNLMAGIVSGNTTIPYLELVRVSKGVENYNINEDEPGDYFEGFKDAHTYWQKAEWIGGNRADRANYIPRIEFEV